MELLSLIEWGIFRLYSPSMGSWLQSYEQLKGGSDMERKLRRLEASGIIKEIGHGSEWAYLLGQEANQGNHRSLEPEKEWARRWDGQWTMLSFDLPGQNSRLRKRLRTWLEQQRFGHLQCSLWVTPFPAGNIPKILHGLEIDPLGFMLFKGRDEFHLMDEDSVSLAWNFGELNGLYAKHLNVLKRIQEALPAKDKAKTDWLSLLCEETEAHSKALLKDPFLPDKLLPRDYLGKQCWKLKKRLQKQIARR
jgi:DNA-binding transcriptional regulator PaaX